LINSGLFNECNLAKELSEEFGQQCVVGSIDLKRSKTGGFQVWFNGGGRLHEAPAKDLLDNALKQEVGEIYLNSMDRDGTGQGLDLDILELLPVRVNKPIILAGGVGNSDHLLVGLRDSRIDAVATANLFNFVGDGLMRARDELLSGGIVLPMWDLDFRTMHEASRSQNSGLDE
jgi:cyclase